MTDAERRIQLLKLIPKHYFLPSRFGGFAILAIVGFIALNQFLTILFPETAIFSSVLAGLFMGALFFKAHHLSHGTIFCPKQFRYILQLSAYCPNLFPPTLWRKLHTEHHKHTNTVLDPDRLYIEDEKKSLPKRIYAFFILPVKGSGSKSNPLMFLVFMGYAFTYSLSAILNKCMPTCTSIPNFTPKQRLLIVFELLLCISVYSALVFLSLKIGNSFLYVLFFHLFIPLMLSTLITSIFIFTQHFSNPILSRNDVFKSTTSIKLPYIFNVFVSNDNYHVEHHLFPTLNPRYYREINTLIQEKWPNDFRYVSFSSAWKSVLNSKIFEPIVEI